MTSEQASHGYEDADPQLLNHFAWSMRWRDRNRSRTAAQRAMDMMRSGAPDAPCDLGLALRTLAWQARWRGDLTVAETMADEARSHLGGCSGTTAMADAESVLGVIYYCRQRHDMARAAVERGYRLIDRWDNLETRIDLMATESSLLRYLGQPERALAILTAALDLSPPVEQARVHHNLGRLLLSMGEVDEALSHAMRAVAQARARANCVILPYALEILGTGQAARGCYERASDSFVEGLELARADGDLRAECQILKEAGGAAIASGQVQLAITLLEKGVSVARSIDDRLWERAALRHLGTAYEAHGDLRRALDAFKALDKLSGAVKN